MQTIFAPLITKGLVDFWDDTKIKPGTRWKAEIENALASAKAAILLVTADFLASDFIKEKELPPLLNKARDNGVTIYWIKIKECLVELTEIPDYQAAHDVNKPLAGLSTAAREAVLSDIARNFVNLSK